MAVFLSALLRLSIFGSLLAALLIFWRVLLKRQVSQAIFYYLWMLVLLRLCVPIGITVPLPAVHAKTMQNDVSARVPALTENAVSKDSPVREEKTGAAAGNTILQVGNTPAFGAYWLERIGNYATFLVILWGLGALACFGRHVWGYMRFSDTLRRSASEILPEALGAADLLEENGLAGRVRLAECPFTHSPVQVGVLQPMVILPKGMEDTRVLRDILCHELTHAKRHDLLFKWLAVAVTSLHWFNPLMILVRKEISRACELSCDEAVMRSMDAAGRRHYGETLLRLAAPSGGRGMPATSFCEEKKQLKERLAAIAAYHKRGLAAAILSMVPVFAMCGCALVSGAKTDQGADPAKNRVENAANVTDAYMDILQGKARFFYVPDAKKPAMEMDIANVPKIFSPDSKYAAIWRYAFLDLEGDGKEEAVLQVIDAAGDMGGYLILCRQDGAVYGFAANYRTFESLKADGTYGYSSPTGTESGICRIVGITKTGYTEEPMIWLLFDDKSGTFSYYKDVEPLTEDAYNKEKDKQDKKPDAVWNLLQFTPAPDFAGI